MTACRWKPSPDDSPVNGCPGCGHLVLLHVGTDVCPICVLADVASQVREHEIRLGKVERGEGIKLL